MDEAEILVAKTSAVFTDKSGRSFRIVKGRTTARRGAKIIRGREHMFEPLIVDYELPGVATTPTNLNPDGTLKRKRGRPPKSLANQNVILTA